ncbi:MAG: hypothetical protein R3F61_38020 [Myxococcota bacterium]
MTRLFLPPALLLLGLACEPTTPSNLNDTDTDVSDTDPPDTDPPKTSGVQIGSEGIISELCSASAIEGTDDLPDFGGTAAEVSDAVLGGFSGSLAGPRPAVDATFTSAATSWAKVDGPDCPLLLLVGATATLSADPELSSDLRGWLLVDVDRDATFVYWGSTWSGNAQPALDAADFDTIEVRLDGAVESGVLSADVGFEGCAGTSCTIEPFGTLSAP